MLQKLHLKILLATIVGLVIIGYAYGRVEVFIAGPRLDISSPMSGEVSSPLIALSATAVNAEEIFLNDRSVFGDENGVLKELVLLSPGYNVVTLSAKDRFGRVVKEEVEFVYTSTLEK